MNRFLLSILIFVCVGIVSCRSHRTVVRGDQGKVVEDYADRPKDGQPTAPPATIDNKYTQALIDEAYSWLGTPYVYGGEAKSGTDCSGFTMMVYSNALGIKLPRVSREQGEHIHKAKIKDLVVGDLIFFTTNGKGTVSHVGIYLGNDKMIHASSTKGVCISDISSQYWIKHYHHSGYVQEYRQKVKSRK